MRNGEKRSTEPRHKNLIHHLLWRLKMGICQWSGLENPKCYSELRWSPTANAPLYLEQQIQIWSREWRLTFHTTSTSYYWFLFCLLIYCGYMCMCVSRGWYTQIMAHVWSGQLEGVLCFHCTSSRDQIQIVKYPYPLNLPLGPLKLVLYLKFTNVGLGVLELPDID